MRDGQSKGIPPAGEVTVPPASDRNGQKSLRNKKSLSSESVPTLEHAARRRQKRLPVETADYEKSRRTHGKNLPEIERKPGSAPHDIGAAQTSKGPYWE